MGLFNFLKYNNLEKALFDQYSQMKSIMDLPLSDAKKIIRDMLD